MSAPRNIVIDVVSGPNGQQPNAGGGTKLPEECACCCDSFNKSQRKAIECPNCDYVSCKECVRIYLLSTTEAPHCMGCKNAWNERFLTENLNAS